MANKNKLKELMDKRSPIRKTVTPVDIYDSGQVDKTTKPQVDKPTSTQVAKPTKKLVVKSTSKQVDKTVSGEMVKYTTHLTKETIKAIKLTALETNRKDYEVVQTAVHKYLFGKENQ